MPRNKTRRRWFDYGVYLAVRLGRVCSDAVNSPIVRSGTVHRLDTL